MSRQKISKIIHYCCFGGNPLPKMAIKCIESWKNIVQITKSWNEKNFDLEINITDNTYAIHHFDGPWHTEEELYAYKVGKKLSKFPARSFFAKFIATDKYRDVISAFQDTLKWVKRRKNRRWGIK